MTSLKLIGLGAAAVLCSLSGLRAESIASRSGGTVYLQAPEPAIVAVPTAAPLSAELTVRARHHRRYAGRRSARVAVASTSPVEVEPAPGPTREPVAEIRAPSGVVLDGPHEGPAPTIRDLIVKHAKENGVPENLAAAVVRIESRFNPNARGGSALGLMQIQYQTARSVGFSGKASGLMQPDTNLHFGMKVLADAYKASHGDLCMTLARYQSGHLTRRLSASNRVYCSRARAFMAKL